MDVSATQGAVAHKADDVISHGGRDWRLVARKAKVGETVLVVNKKEPAHYENGDVLEVASVQPALIKFKSGRVFDELWHDEYLVLEPIEVIDPPQEPLTNAPLLATFGLQTMTLAGEAIPAEQVYEVFYAGKRALAAEKHNDEVELYRAVREKMRAVSFDDVELIAELHARAAHHAKIIAEHRKEVGKWDALLKQSREKQVA
jgi:hypothetical protein